MQYGRQLLERFLDRFLGGRGTHASGAMPSFRPSQHVPPPDPASSPRSSSRGTAGRHVAPRGVLPLDLDPRRIAPWVYVDPGGTPRAVVPVSPTTALPGDARGQALAERIDRAAKIVLYAISRTYPEIGDVVPWPVNGAHPEFLGVARTYRLLETWTAVEHLAGVTGNLQGARKAVSAIREALVGEGLSTRENTELHLALGVLGRYGGPSLAILEQAATTDRYAWLAERPPASPSATADEQYDPELYGTGPTTPQDAVDSACVEVMSAAWTRHPELRADFMPGDDFEEPTTRLARVLGNPQRAALVRDGVASKLAELEDRLGRQREDNGARLEAARDLHWFREGLVALDQAGAEFAPLGVSQYVPFGTASSTGRTARSNNAGLDDPGLR